MIKKGQEIERLQKEIDTMVEARKEIVTIIEKLKKI